MSYEIRLHESIGITVPPPPPPLAPNAAEEYRDVYAALLEARERKKVREKAIARKEKALLNLLRKQRAETAKIRKLKREVKEKYAPLKEHEDYRDYIEGLTQHLDNIHGSDDSGMGSEMRSDEETRPESSPEPDSSQP